MFSKLYVDFSKISSLWLCVYVHIYIGLRTELVLGLGSKSVICCCMILGYFLCDLLDFSGLARH